MINKKNKIALAVLQFSSAKGSIFKNFETLKKMLQRVPRATRLIVLPEMWPSGFNLEGGELLLGQTQIILKDLKRIARNRRCYIVGSHLERGKKGFYNAATVIGPQGKIVGRYHKVHLFQLGGEDKKFLAGHRSSVVKTALAKLGLLICYDIRFPELVRKEVLKGAQILIVPAAWPLQRIDHYLSLLKVRAIENLCFVVSANKVGRNEEGIQYGGHSVVFGPWGENLGSLKTKSGILRVTIDLEKMEKLRKSFPVFEARREEVYRK